MFFCVCMFLLLQFVVSQRINIFESSIYYNDLPDISEIPHFTLESATTELDAFGKVIRSHGFENDIGAVLLHSHFQIDSTEKVVVSVTNTTSLIDIDTLAAYSMPMTKNDIIVECDGYIVPYMFDVRTDGVNNNNNNNNDSNINLYLTPIQYLCGKALKNNKNINEVAIESTLPELLNNYNFWKEIADAKTQISLPLGIFVNYFSHTLTSSLVFNENTYENRHQSLMIKSVNQVNQKPRLTHFSFEKSNPISVLQCCFESPSQGAHRAH